jgi:VIT1/CCC1 family predicted Fe2+/Mn2+ transporter
VFTLVFFASLPAVLPYMLIDDAWVALRVSNALLIGIMFFVGYRWAHYTNFNPWAAAGTLVALGITLVLIAIPLGG